MGGNFTKAQTIRNMKKRKETICDDRSTADATMAVPGWLGHCFWILFLGNFCAPFMDTFLGTLIFKQFFGTLLWGYFLDTFCDTVVTSQ